MGFHRTISHNVYCDMLLGVLFRNMQILLHRYLLVYHTFFFLYLSSFMFFLHIGYMHVVYAISLHSIKYTCNYRFRNKQIFNYQENHRFQYHSVGVRVCLSYNIACAGSESYQTTCSSPTHCWQSRDVEY